MDDALWQGRLAELQDTADRLARARGLQQLKGGAAQDVYLRVPDYEFFTQRS